MNKRDIEMLSEAVAHVLNETDVPNEMVKSGHWCKDKDWPDPKKLHPKGSKECEDGEEGEEGVMTVSDLIELLSEIDPTKALRFYSSTENRDIGSFQDISADGVIWVGEEV